MVDLMPNDVYFDTEYSMFFLKEPINTVWYIVYGIYNDSNFTPQWSIINFAKDVTTANKIIEKNWSLYITTDFYILQTKEEYATAKLSSSSK